MATWTAGDTLPDLTGTTGVDLTAAAAVEVHVRTSSGTLITRPAVVAVGTVGDWSFPWLVSELDVPGVFTSEVQATGVDGKIRTYPGPSFRVKPQLDGSTPPFAAPLTVVDNLDGTTTLTWS